VTRSLVVQSILYGNEADGIVRAAEATAHAASMARTADLVGEWSLAIGDCSEVPVLSEANLKVIGGYVERAGGVFVHEVFGENLGHGGGHNRLAKSTSSELLLILNPDALLGPDTISALVNTVVDGVALSDGRQLPLEHPKDYDPVTGDESWASGACSMTLRSVFDEVGGFDHDTFFMYCDDVDYSWRVKLAGYRVAYQPGARVFHDKRLTVDGDIIPSAAEVYFSAEAAVLLAHKYSRSDISDRILDSFRGNPDETYQKVVRVFEERRSSGKLPVQIDSKHRVGQFINGNYARHRY